MIDVNALKTGDVVKVVIDIDLQPYATIRAGESGTVVYIGKEEIDIKMDSAHKGLAPWDNCIWITDQATDVSGALALVTSEESGCCTKLSSLLLFCLSQPNAIPQLE